MLGYGWSFSLDSRLKKWPDGDITWVGFDGTTYWFKEENGTYVSYADGQQTVYPKLTLDPNASNPLDQDAFIMEWSDQLRYRFKNDGRFWLIQDRNNNEIFFSWTGRPTYHGGLDYRIQSVTDTAGHEVEFQYKQDGELYSTVITELDGIGNEPETKRKFFFMYDSDDRFVGFRDPSQKMTRFTYDALKRVNRVIDNGSNVRDDSGITTESVVTTWTFDAKNRIQQASMTRKQDQVKEFVRIGYGDREADVERPSGTYKIRWDEANRPISRVQKVATADGEAEAETKFEYDRNFKIEEVDPLGRSSASAMTRKAGLMRKCVCPARSSIIAMMCRAI